MLLLGICIGVYVLVATMGIALLCIDESRMRFHEAIFQLVVVLLWPLSLSASAISKSFNKKIPRNDIPR